MAVSLFVNSQNLSASTKLWIKILKPTVIVSLCIIALLGTNVNVRLPKYTKITIFESYPHDKTHFTQGLQFDGDTLYESVGLYAHSKLIKYENFISGAAAKKSTVFVFPKNEFGEGLTLAGDSIYILTWKSRKGYVLNKHTFETERLFGYAHDGWGIAFDGEFFVISDGTSTLHVYNRDLSPSHTITAVDSDGAEIKHINELEFVNGILFCNIWYKNHILGLKLDHEKRSSVLQTTIDLSEIQKIECAGRRAKCDVLNGIAFIESEGKFLVTGKFWSHFYKFKI